MEQAWGALKGRTDKHKEDKLKGSGVGNAEAAARSVSLGVVHLTRSYIVAVFIWGGVTLLLSSAAGCAWLTRSYIVAVLVWRLCSSDEELHCCCAYGLRLMLQDQNAHFYCNSSNSTRVMRTAYIYRLCTQYLDKCSHLSLILTRNLCPFYRALTQPSRQLRNCKTWTQSISKA